MSLGELPSLKYLDIRQMENVERIGWEFCTLDPRVKAFHSLSSLFFEDMYRFSEWSGVQEGDFSCLETMFIGSAFELMSLPPVLFVSLRNFTLYNCRNVVTLPASTTLQELLISKCANLSELPALPSLQSLKLLNCPSLATVSQFPSLTVLHVCDPFKEEILQRLVNSHMMLEELHVESDTINSICLDPLKLPSLKNLDVRCPNLKSCNAFAGLTSLKILWIRCSPRLHIPDSLRSQLEELRLFASMAVKWAMDKLSSLLAPVNLMPVASSSSSSSSSQGLEDLRMLERTMRRIHATLVDAEEYWNIREESAKLRLKELKELAYGAEDVVEEYEYEDNDEQCSEAGLVPVPNELAVRAKKLVQRFEEMKDYMKYFSISDQDGERRIVPDIQSTRDLGHMVAEQSIVGRESDKDTVIEMLMSGQGSNDASHISVLAIVGMGGLGKTTLAQLVYNDPMVFQSFDVRVWVYVSEHFDPRSLTKKIIVSVTKNSIDLSELVDLQERLAHEIWRKKCLLVLDDVWNERWDCWEILCKPLSAARQCNILVTTRNVAVARLVQTMPHFAMDHLSPDDSWTLFEKTVTVQGNVIQGNLVDIAKKIVEKCDRLPLAIKTLGSMLRYETNERSWIHVLESEIWDLDKQHDEVLPALELSYKNMPMHLKQCFVSLCLFPKDYSLDETEVIRLWGLLGILQGDEWNNEDEFGSQYYDELVQRSFIQISFGSGIMHDLIHDLACHLSGNEFFRLEGDKSVTIPQNARFMSIIDCHASVQFLAASHSLRAIIVLGDDYSKVTNAEQLFWNCKNLRVFSHSDRRILSGSNLDDALPRYISAMKLLRHLEWQWDAPSGIYPLINLHTFPDIRICRCGRSFNLRELKNLNKIMGRLRIIGLGNLSHVQDANEAQLMNKKHIQFLELNFSEMECHHSMPLQLDVNITPEEVRYENLQYQDSQQPENVTVPHNQILESLRPHEGLRGLRISAYNCQSYPRWLGDASFSKLTYIEINGTNKVMQQCVPTLGELPFLEYLRIGWMSHVEHIGREFCTRIPSNKGFPSLIRLEFSDMPQWSEWSGLDDGDFPSLCSLSISDCNQLCSLPSYRFSSLQRLDLVKCNVISIIPAGGTFTYIQIVGCYGLHTVLTQPSLLKMWLADCPKLGAVGSMPKLNKLDIYKCPNLTSVGIMPELNSLKTGSSLESDMVYNWIDRLTLLDYSYIWYNTLMGISTIPVLHNLNELGLLCCPGITEVPTLPSLSKLWIYRCPDLSVIGSLPSLTTLYLKDPLLKGEVLYSLLNDIDHPRLNCISILCETMMNLSLEPQRLCSLRKLRLSCANLQYCDGLSGFTFLEEIKIWGCPKLPIHSLLPRQLQSALDLRDRPALYIGAFDKQ
uniref:NB-ARC domain-containing protein n=1 Tax=Oryza nivara TaxID=4536 RepID=A0A0E0J204_ORYNI